MYEILPILLAEPVLADTVYYARNIYEMAPAAASRPRPLVQLLSRGQK